MTNALILLLIAQVTAEWVEISQHHYRKPIRTYSPFTTPHKVIDVEDTTKPWTYNNRSVTEYNWNKSPARPQNTGNSKRIQLIGSTVQTTERVKFEEYPELDVDVIDYELRPTRPTKTTIEFNENGQQKGTIEKVPNLGNIKRVQLINTPVKSPAVILKREREKYSYNRPKNIPRDEDLQTETTEFEDKKTTDPFVRRIYVNKVKNPHDNERPATFPPDDEDMYAENINNLNNKGSNLEYKNHTAVKNVYSTTMTSFITESSEFSTDDKRQNNLRFKIPNRKNAAVTEKDIFFTTASIDNDEDMVTFNNVKMTKPTTQTTTKNNVYKNVIEDETESIQNKVKYISGNDEPSENPTESLHTNMKSKNTAPEKDTPYKNEAQKGKKDGKPNEANTGTKKVDTMENVVKFMRVVADTISSNTRRSFGGKMQYLHELKDNILANIEERIDATWPDDDRAGARRHSRSAQASPRGHVHIPSSESALMTISFLTFAVFLIKLVLVPFHQFGTFSDFLDTGEWRSEMDGSRAVHNQVIQTYKQKAMMYAPVVVAASGRNVFAHHGHN